MKHNVQIYINDILINIDEDTTIGVNFEGFSTDSLGKIYLSHTNTFSIPLTNHNRTVLGFVDNMNMNTTVVQGSWYSDMTFKMYTDGLLVFTGMVYVDGINNGRIELFIIKDKDVMDILKQYTMWDVTQAIIPTVNAELDTKFSEGATWDNIVGYMSTGDNMVWLPYSVGTLSEQYPYDKFNPDTQTHSCENKYNDTDNTDNKERYNLNSENVLTTEVVTNNDVVGDYKTGCIYVRLYELLASTFGDMGFDISFDHNVYMVLSKQFIRMPDIITYMSLTTYKYSFRTDDTYHYAIGDDREASSKKIPFIDLVKYICQEYCLIFSVTDGVVEFHSIQNIQSTTSQRIKTTNITSRTLYIPGVPQESYITYEGLGDDTTLTGGKQIISRNQNIDKGSSDTVLFSIKRFLPAYFAYLYDNGQIRTNTHALNTTDPKCNEKFIIVQKISTQTNYRVKVCRYYLGNETFTHTYLYQAINRTVSEMGFWDEFTTVCEYPDRITVTVVMNPFEINTFKPWNKVTFDTIPGEWLVEGVSDYNPRLENPEIEITAIRLR